MIDVRMNFEADYKIRGSIEEGLKIIHSYIMSEDFRNNYRAYNNLNELKNWLKNLERYLRIFNRKGLIKQICSLISGRIILTGKELVSK